MYQISPMNWIMIGFFLIYLFFYMFIYLFSFEKCSFLLKFYKKIYVK